MSTAPKSPQQGYRLTGTSGSAAGVTGSGSSAGSSGRDTVRATFEGEALEAAAGASVAAALVASGRNAWRSTREGAPRGLFCGIGICFDCIVEIDGESGQRSCMIPLRDGMDVRCDRGGSAEPDTTGATGATDAHGDNEPHSEGSNA